MDQSNFGVCSKCGRLEKIVITFFGGDAVATWMCNSCWLKTSKPEVAQEQKKPKDVAPSSIDMTKMAEQLQRFDDWLSGNEKIGALYRIGCTDDVDYWRALPMYHQERGKYRLEYFYVRMKKRPLTGETLTLEEGRHLTVIKIEPVTISYEDK